MSRFLSTAAGTATTSGTSCSATVGGGTVGATAIVVLVAINQSNASAATVTSVTDTAGNTYTKATNSTGSPNVAGDTSIEIWYKLSPATSSGSQVYTVHTGNAAPSMAMRVVVLGSTTTLDTTATLAQGSATNSSLALTTTASDDFVLTGIAVGADQSGSGTVITTSAPGDFPAVIASTGTASTGSSLYVIFESRPGARAVTQNFSQSASGKYVAAAVAIKAPLAANPPGTSGISLTSTLIKDPGAALDYTFNWINWLSGTESITSCVVTSDSGINVDYYSAPGGNYVVAWLSGGVSGNSYTVTCSITTSLGRTDNRSITITVQNQ